MSVSSMLASQGSAVVRTSTRLIASSRNGWAMPSTRSVNCRIHSVASALDPEIDPETRILAEMKIEAEHGGAARHQIAFVPPRQIAAGIPLEQRIAIPQGGASNINGMAMAAIQADRESAAVRARNICVLM